jgi:uncharacterized membrane protein
LNLFSTDFVLLMSGFIAENSNGFLFEAVMLICFGLAWPVSIAKSWRSRSNAGKSLAFLVIIEAGYVSGTIYKAFYNFDFVIILYILNTVMVLTDICVYLRNFVRTGEING